MVLAAVNPAMATADRRATVTRVVLVVEYDGAGYHGFQWQAGGVTIQQKLEEALEQLTGETARVAGASRTDAGVHARGQVVSFITRSSHSPETFVKGMNYYLPGDIAVRAAYRVKDSFHVRHQALSREYQYCILNRRTRSPLDRRSCLLVGGQLDVAAMNQACQALVGEHDFASFTSGSGAGLKSTVRRVYRAEVNREAELVIFTMVANAFLTHQIRNTVGMLIKVGLGKMNREEFCAIMEAKKEGLAGPMAPAHGLCLVSIKYPRFPEEEAWIPGVKEPGDNI